MPSFKENHNPNPNPNPNPKFIDPPKKRRQSLPPIFQLPNPHYLDSPKTPKSLNNDPFSLLSDESLSLILSKVSTLKQSSNSLVCKRWCKLQGQLIHSLSLLDWDFLVSGRLIYRFPNLIELNLLPACINTRENSGIILSHKLVFVNLDSSSISDTLIGKDTILESNVVDKGLKILSFGCSNLRKLALVNCTEEGLAYLAEKCYTLQELEIHCCRDNSLRSVSGFQNLQVLKLVGCVEGLYDCVVTDIGLTILAYGCPRLVRLELTGCEGSYDGIKAIGQCCLMLEELMICDHRMDGGWLAALSYCGNLKTLKIKSCGIVDSCPGPVEYLGLCPTLEELFLERCQLRDKDSTNALFIVCGMVRETSFQDCWGLDNDIFRYATICRRLKSLSLEGCSLLTTEGLDYVVHAWKELETLKVVSCNNIKDTEISPELATLFSTLKELKWRPGSRSLMAPSLAGTRVGKKGGRFLKWMATMVEKRK